MDLDLYKKSERIVLDTLRENFKVLLYMCMIRYPDLVPKEVIEIAKKTGLWQEIRKESGLTYIFR